MKLESLGIKGVKVRLPQDDHYRKIETTKIEPAPGTRNDLDSVAYEFEIPANKEARPSSVIFAYKLAKFARDSSSFFSVLATEEMNFDFTFDPRLDLSYTNVHALDFMDETPPDSPNRLKLRTREPMFPDNGIQFWWSPNTSVIESLGTALTSHGG